MTQPEEKTPDRTASELEQQRNVLVFLSPSLEVEVRAALGSVEIPLRIVGAGGSGLEFSLRVRHCKAGLASAYPTRGAPGLAAGGRLLLCTKTP